MKIARSRVAQVAAVLSGFFLAAGVAAQQYPSKPIRLVVPFPPGGAHGRAGPPAGEKEVIAAVSAKETAELLDKNGAEPLTSTPAELAAIIKDGVAKYAKVVKDAGVKPE